MDRTELDRISEKIIGAAFQVSSTLGAGFVEKVYENALGVELRKAGLVVEQQHPIRVHYGGVVVGEFAADLIVEGAVMVELKAAAGIDAAHVAQCLNYLKATGLTVCLLLNFGQPKLQIKRIVHRF